VCVCVYVCVYVCMVHRDVFADVVGQLVVVALVGLIGGFNRCVSYRGGGFNRCVCVCSFALAVQQLP
jgi:hypothetical protein